MYAVAFSICSLRLKDLIWLTSYYETLQSKETICMQDRFAKTPGTINTFVYLKKKNNPMFDLRIRCEAEHPAIEASARKTQVQLRALLRSNSSRGMVTVERMLLPGSLEKKNHFHRKTFSFIYFRFRDYLLHGNKAEGLEFAMRSGLWGHALFLASKMDQRTYAGVMTMSQLCIFVHSDKYPV